MPCRAASQCKPVEPRVPPHVQALLAGTLLLLSAPRPAESCSCGQASLAAHARSSDVVFVGTVTSVDVPEPTVTRSTDADGRIWTSVGSPGPATVTFRVGSTLKGQPDAVVRLRGDGSNCDLTFAVGEIWVVYADRHGDRLTAGKCSRTRLRRHAGADVAYFDGLARGRAEGVVFGPVVRRGLDGAGNPVLTAMPPGPVLVVVAEVDGRRFAIPADRGTFDLVLPVGSASVWVERAGRRVSPANTVSVTRGGEHQVLLVASDEAP